MKEPSEIVKSEDGITQLVHDFENSDLLIQLQAKLSDPETVAYRKEWERKRIEKGFPI